MKTSVKMYIYYVFLVIGIVVMLVGPEPVRTLFTVGVIAAAVLGFGMTVSVERKLEWALQSSTKSGEIVECFQSSVNPILHLLAKILQKYANDLESGYSAKVEDRQSKINSLQSQINPHFLYNTLECIRSEAVCQECDSIARMAKALASFFRYSISRKENVVTIEDELNNIQHYIMIQNYRFEDKFLFQVEMAPEDKRVYACQIPKMTIQPIVENAIFHGLETKQGECRVAIRIRLTKNLVLLTVSDNGIGMDERELKKLRDGMEQESVGIEKKSAHGNGIALYNVNQRLKLLFGENYGIHIYSTKGEGTDVEIQMPVRTGREAG